MKVYIVLEHPDGFGGTAKDMADIVHGVFFDQRGATDFVRGMLSYIGTYEDRRLFFEAGRAKDENDVIYFQVVEKEAYGG